MAKTTIQERVAGNNLRNQLVSELRLAKRNVSVGRKRSLLKIDGHNVHASYANLNRNYSYWFGFDVKLFDYRSNAREQVEYILVMCGEAHSIILYLIPFLELNAIFQDAEPVYGASSDGQYQLHISPENLYEAHVTKGPVIDLQKHMIYRGPMDANMITAIMFE